MKTTQLVALLYPPFGLMDIALRELGFCVVQANGLDVDEGFPGFNCPGGRFDGIVSHIEWDLLPIVEKILKKAQPAWWLTRGFAPTCPNVSDVYHCRTYQIGPHFWNFGSTTNTLYPDIDRTVDILSAAAMFAKAIAKYLEYQHGK